MNSSRIQSVMDIPRLRASRVAIIGNGGSSNFACNLARSAVGGFVLFDPDEVDSSNIARQGHLVEDIGTPKVSALARQIARINAAAQVRSHAIDFCSLNDEQVDEQFADVDLLVFATDRFAAQARGNEVALRLQKAALWPGLYRGAGAGEIIFWHPGLDACYRCLCARRYEAQANARKAGRAADPGSDGATIFDIDLLDAIAGHLAIGLLTRGSDNRFGRLIDALGDRNFIQIKIDPSYAWNGRDVIREQLGVATNCDTFFAWNAIVRRDPVGGNDYCPDCEKFRGHSFLSIHGGPIRFKPGSHQPPHASDHPAAAADTACTI